jgi:CBS domain-containing protein
VGRTNYYTVDATRQYIETLTRVDSELTVLIVDGNGKFVAMAEAATVLGYLKDPAQGQQLIDAIGNGNINYLKTLPGLVFESLSEKATNSDALQKMRELNTKTMAVVDDSGKPRGIVKRSDIVAHLLESLATPSKK